MFRDQPEISGCFTQQKTVLKKKSLIETAASGFGTKEGGWGKREMGAKNQPEFGERCCVPLCSVTDWNHLDKKHVH